MTHTTTKAKQLTPFLIGVPVILFVILTALVSLLFFTVSSWKSRALPETYIAGIPVGGMTESEIIEALRRPTDNFLTEGFIFDIAGTRSTVSPTILPLDPSGTPTQLVTYDLVRSAQTALQADKNSILTLLPKALLKTGERRDIPLNLAISPDWETTVSQSLASQFSAPPTNAQFSLISESPLTLAIAQEKAGSSINPDRVMEQTILRASTLSREPITLTLTTIPASITMETLTPLLPTATDMIARPLALTASGQEWNTTARERFSWLTVGGDLNVPTITLNPDALTASIKPIKDALEIAPRDAQFTLKDGKVATFVPSREGVTVDSVALTKRIQEEYLTGTSSRIEIPLTVAVPRVAAVSGMIAGIEELIGKGQTNFVGSPTNRVKNIKRGAELLNGFLIQPGEEFSLLQALKPFTIEHGYLSELVIKGNRTTPEVGGGLCQIATTVFRAALDAGLTITKRQNHSYRVSYYEPPVGMDATIYDPAPDFAFVNDTGSPILMAATIEKTAITVYFYGKSDGRTRIIGTPTVFDYVQPPPKKVIETLELKPGETRCTEKAHVGASASFDYKVTMPGGEVRERTFKSKYRPWQEVCLVGVAQLSTPPAAPSAQ